MKDKQLYERILAFDIDGGPAELTFEMRLARENGWTEDFARRVIVEYKRFVYLSMVSGHACSPSEPVDEAWHLHLTYTESYWTRFVGGVLPTPLHHNPTKGGSTENAKHEDLFKRTLDSYESEFQTKPPADIWLVKSQPKPTAIDLKEHLLISRSKLRLGLVLAAGAVGAALIFVGCVPVLAQTGNEPGEDATRALTGVLGFVLCGLGAVAVVGTALFIIFMNRARNGSSNTVIVDGGADCSGGVDVGCSGGACSGGANCSGDTGQAAAPVDTGGGGSDSSSTSSSSCSSSSCSSSSCSSG